MTDTLFIRLLHHEDKGAALVDRIASMREGRTDDDVYAVNSESFRQVPNTPFCYWVTERILRLFLDLPPFESEGRTVKQGLATADDFRFVRAWWEVPSERILDGGQSSVGDEQEKAGEEKWSEKRIREFQAWCRKRTHEGKRWAPFAKGGEYSPYYADIHLVVNWEKDGVKIRNFIDPKTGKTNSRPQNTDYYFRPGLTWPRRSYRIRSAPVPAGCIFSHAGMMAFVPVEDMLAFLGLMGSAPFDFFVRSRTGSFGGSQFEVGLIQQSPIMLITNPKEKLAFLTSSISFLTRTLHIANEISYAFLLPDKARLFEVYDKTDIKIEMSCIQAEIDKTVFDLYGFTDEERKALGGRQHEGNESFDKNEELKAPENTEIDSDADCDQLPTSDHPQLTTNLLSWCIGITNGRWDIRYATGERQPPELPDPFDPLPVCPPGMLQGPDGLPAKPEDVPSDYPLRIDWDGILVDDPGHEDDIISRVQDVVEVIWKDRAEAIEREACEILGVRELRDYFRKPGNGGFWMDHVKRYSKSRRKAPIYWYLRSAKGNYGLWLYYHRLDKDILFKALLNYVEPKIRLEEDRLKTLRGRKEAAGSSGREAKQIEKGVDRQEQFISELRDFEEKLRRAADLHLDFDLNDGVILNITPIWELVPWKEPQKYWEELKEGKYDWSHIALQLWPERVKEACKKDRSIAIAHGLEDFCKAPTQKPKRSASSAKT